MVLACRTLTFARIAGTAALGAAALMSAAPAFAAENGRGIILAQGMRLSTRPGNEAREQDQYLDVVKKLRTTCDNAAWTLWHSNSYDRWRSKKSSMLSMHYSSSSYPTLPAAPSAWPEPLRSKLDAAAKRANDVLKESGDAFKELANYINAKDYEDDKFKKGDELNRKLLAAGEECHGLQASLMGLYTETAQTLIDQRKGGAAKPDVVATMVGDWQKARALSAELARHDKLDPMKLDTLVKDISTLADDRKANFEPLKQNPDTWVKRFYEGMLNDDVAVKMRRYLRDAKSPKSFKEMAEDRPRSNFWSVRSEIDVGMPDAILRYIQYGK